MNGSVKKVKGGESLIDRVFHAAGIGLALIDTEGCFLRGNPALQRLLQVSEEEMLSSTLLDFCSPQDSAACYDLIHEVSNGDSALQELELSLVSRQGTTLWVHMTASPLQAEQDTENPIVLTVHDSSDYFEVQEAIEQSVPQKSWERPLRQNLNA